MDEEPMNFNILPHYPTKPSPAPKKPLVENEYALPSRTRPILINLLLLITIAVVLFELRQITNILQRSPALPPLPLDFKLVAQRYEEVRIWASAEEVEALLGPPTERFAFDDELQAAEEEATIFHFPIRDGSFWYRWTNPRDKGQWVAVLLAGQRPKVYWKIKKGF